MAKQIAALRPHIPIVKAPDDLRMRKPAFPDPSCS